MAKAPTVKAAMVIGMRRKTPCSESSDCALSVNDRRNHQEQAERHQGVVDDVQDRAGEAIAVGQEGSANHIADFCDDDIGQHTSQVFLASASAEPQTIAMAAAHMTPLVTQSCVKTSAGV